MFLGWFDDTPKKAAAEKLEEAVERYVAKFGEAPDLCLVNQKDATTHAGVEVKVVEYVRPNHFWVGKASALPGGTGVGSIVQAA
ncbi:MAG TPA: hypothetical protein VFH60_03550 [Chloroflexia bacterium]|nr:hypothetical protein [Chloroflexia bacterium]